MAVERCIDRGTPGGRGWRRSAGGGNVDQHWAQRSWGWSHARGVVWRSGRSRASVDPVANYLVSLQHRPLHSHPLPGSAAPDARSAVRHGHAPNRPAHGRISNKPSKPSPPALGQTRQLEATTADRRSPPRVHSPPVLCHSIATDGARGTSNLEIAAHHSSISVADGAPGARRRS